MANAATFSNREWELVKNAPSWVYAAVSAADARQEKATLRNVRELKGYQDAVKAYQTRSELVKAIIAGGGDLPQDVKDATLNEALSSLAKINDLLKKKVDRAEGDDVREFLMALGQATAEAASEKVLGLGDKVSQEEAAALGKVENALEATSEHKRARMDAALARQKEEAAAAAAAADNRRAAEARAKAEAATEDKRREAEQARLEAAREKREAAERKLRAEKKRAEAEEKIEAAREKLAAREKAREEAKAAEEAAEEAAEAAQWLGEYTVVSGDNLSGISKKFYGTPNNWQAIYQANKDIIGENPNLIRVGQVFKIPNLDK